MEVTEAIEKKKKLENKISALLREFSTETGVSVTEIKVTTQDMAYGGSVITQLKVITDLL